MHEHRIETLIYSFRKQSAPDAVRWPFHSLSFRKRPTDYTSRTFSVKQSILDRIDRLSDAQWLYSKKAIINKLLDDALKNYGY